jgi:chromosome segregation ATPase
LATTKESNPKPKLEVAEDASVPERIEAVRSYLDARYGKLSDEELGKRIADVRSRLREVEQDLETADAGLSDALMRDEAEIADADLDAPVSARHYNKERERLSKLIPLRWRLRKQLAELDLAQRIRTGSENTDKARELLGKIEPTREEMRQLEAQIRVLEDERAMCLHAVREATAGLKNLTAQVVELQRPDLGNLTHYLGLDR